MWNTIPLFRYWQRRICISCVHCMSCMIQSPKFFFNVVDHKGQTIPITLNHRMIDLMVIHVSMMRRLSKSLFLMFGKCIVLYTPLVATLGFYSLSGKTSYRQILWSLEATRLDVTMVISFWNLTGISQRCCLGSCQISERLEQAKSESRGFETSRDLAVRQYGIVINNSIINTG